ASNRGARHTSGTLSEPTYLGTATGSWKHAEVRMRELAYVALDRPAVTWTVRDRSRPSRPGPSGAALRPTVPPAGPRLPDMVRSALRTRHYSRRTEASYVRWIRRFVIFHGKRHPRELGAGEISEFLSDLAVRSGVSASTQNQALSALLFLYRNVLGIELDWVHGV